MIGAAEIAGVKLMIAYRLHFEDANMTAVKLLRSGKLGDPRFFVSSFAMQVRPDNIKQIYLQDPEGYWIEVNDDKF